MDDLDSGGRRIERVERRVERLAGRIDEQRTQPLAAAEHGVTHCAVKLGGRLTFRRQHAREHGVGARGKVEEFVRQLFHAHRFVIPANAGIHFR